jgi:hypothetical protein
VSVVTGVYRDFRRTARLIGACQRLDYRGAAMIAGSNAVHLRFESGRAHPR